MGPVDVPIWREQRVTSAGAHGQLAYGYGVGNLRPAAFGFASAGVERHGSSARLNRRGERWTSIEARWIPPTESKKRTTAVPSVAVVSVESLGARLSRSEHAARDLPLEGSADDQGSMTLRVSGILTSLQSLQQIICVIPHGYFLLQ